MRRTALYDNLPQKDLENFYSEKINNYNNKQVEYWKEQALDHEECCKIMASENKIVNKRIAELEKENYLQKQRNSELENCKEAVYVLEGQVEC